MPRLIGSVAIESDRGAVFFVSCTRALDILSVPPFIFLPLRFLFFSHVEAESFDHLYFVDGAGGG